MEYFLCMMDISFTEAESNIVDSIIKRLVEQNQFEYRLEPIKLSGQNGLEYLKKYKITWPHEDKHLEEKESETSYLSKSDEAILMAACQSKNAKELFLRCIFGYRYSSPARLEMMTFKKPFNIYMKEKAEKRKRFDEMRAREAARQLKEERDRQRQTA